MDRICQEEKEELSIDDLPPHVGATIMEETNEGSNFFVAIRFVTFRKGARTCTTAPDRSTFKWFVLG
jgi:hypothetical protein